MDRDEHEDLLRRVERLERRYHLWRRTAVAAVGVAAALLMYGAYTFAQKPGEAPKPAQDPSKGDVSARVPLDQSGMRTTYTNFFRATGNPDEVLLDFGLYSQVVTPAGPETVKLTDRLVMNFYTAKKLQTVLQTLVSRHEEAYGELQLDPQKRLRPKRPID